MFLWDLETKMFVMKIKKLLAVTALFSLSILVNAQTQITSTVTKFLGIPIDGTKREMVQNLINKGYYYNNNLDYLEGEFNGYDVRIHVVTNNNKVYRIMVEDTYSTSETDIKIRFNRLCQQFGNNQRYISLKEYEISEQEDISHEMSVNNKRFEASFYQIDQAIDSITIIKEMQSLVYNKYGNDKNIDDLNDNEKLEVFVDYLSHYIEKFSKNSVWFMINENYGKYKILMYYDNLRNQANGDDL